MSAFHFADLHWRSLGRYMSGLRAISARAATPLGAQSFVEIARTDWSELPAPATFEVTGGTLGYRHYQAAESRRALVLVHGSGCFGDLTHAMAQRLAAHDIASVYSLDMRGHGLSEGARGHAVVYPGQLQDDLSAFLRFVRASARPSHVVLGGHSAGGGVVLAFARGPDRDLADGFVFLAPFLGLGSPVNRAQFGGWVSLRSSVIKAVALANLLGVRRFNDATVLDFDTAASGDERFVRSWSFNTMMAFGPGLWDPQAEPIAAHKPVLVLACENDECFHQPLYRQAFATLAPQARLPRVGPGGHWDLLVNPRAAVLLARWLVETAAPADSTPRRPVVATRSAA